MPTIDAESGSSSPESEVKVRFLPEVTSEASLSRTGSGEDGDYSYYCTGCLRVRPWCMTSFLERAGREDAQLAETVALKDSARSEIRFRIEFRRTNASDVLFPFADLIERHFACAASASNRQDVRASP